MLQPGDLVIVDFPGAIGIKTRPAVVLSTNLVTLDDGSLPAIGHLSDRDWQEVQTRLKLALAVP